MFKGKFLHWGEAYKCLRISYLQHLVVNKISEFDSGSRT